MSWLQVGSGSAGAVRTMDSSPALSGSCLLLRVVLTHWILLRDPLTL